MLCGQTNAKGSVTVDAAAAMTGQRTASVGSPFAVAASGPLTPGGRTSIDVTLTTPFRAPGQLVSQTLSLSLPEGGARPIVVSATGRGAVIVFDRSYANSGGSTSFVMKNTGNDTANVVLQGGGGTNLGFDPPNAVISAGAAKTIVVLPNGATGDFSVTAIQRPGLPGAVCSSGTLLLTIPPSGGTDPGSN